MITEQIRLSFAMRNVTAEENRRVLKKIMSVNTLLEWLNILL